MSHQAVVFDHDLKLGERIASDPLRKSTVDPIVGSAKSHWSERLKNLFSKLSKALEGDQEYHKYLGM